MSLQPGCLPACHPGSSVASLRACASAPPPACSRRALVFAHSPQERAAPLSLRCTKGGPAQFCRGSSFAFPFPQTEVACRTLNRRCPRTLWRDEGGKQGPAASGRALLLALSNLESTRKESTTGTPPPTVPVCFSVPVHLHAESTGQLLAVSCVSCWQPLKKLATPGTRLCV